MKISRKGILIFCLLLLSVIILMPTTAFAEEDILRFGNGIKIEGNQIVGDVIVFGGPVTVEGTTGDVIAFGGAVQSTGVINGDTVVFGGNVSIDGPVAGDIVAFGGGLSLGEDAVVNGDIITFGGGVNKHADAIIRGSVVKGNSEMLIKGPHIFRDVSPQLFSGIAWWFKIASSIIMVVIGWLIAMLMPRNMDNIIDKICNDGPKSFGIGLLIKLLSIPITIALLITLLGIPLIPIFWIALWFTQLMGLAALGLLLGRKIFNKLGSNISIGVAALVGLIILALFRQIPFAGVIILFFIKSLVLGAVVISKFGTGSWGNKTV